MIQAIDTWWNMSNQDRQNDDDTSGTKYGRDQYGSPPRSNRPDHHKTTGHSTMRGYNTQGSVHSHHHGGRRGDSHAFSLFDS